MKVLYCHNYYQQAGGEDQVFLDESRLFAERGHEIIRHTVHNDSIEKMGRLEVARKTLWNRSSYRELRKLLQRERPDVVHFTNTFPLISPAAYYAARKENVPVVQSLHNYRIICPGANLFRDNKPCEDCLGRSIPWPAIRNKCYRSSRMATSVVTAMSGAHRLLATWKKSVDLYIALSHFSADRFIQGGLPREKMVVKRNFVSPDPGLGAGAGGYAMFVGRLTPEKGLLTILDAWDQLGETMPLKILGTGPLEETLRKRTEHNDHIELLGHQPVEQVLDILKDAACLVMPSQWYENCPKTLIEAMAVGAPSITSQRGAMAEMVDHLETGFLINPTSPTELAQAVRQLADSSALAQKMRAAARRKYEQCYTAEQNYHEMLAIYERVLDQKSQPIAKPSTSSSDQSKPSHQELVPMK